MMNLNSLLNGNPSAVDQSKESGHKNLLSKLGRNRIPWDADGYCLSIDTASIKSAIPHQINEIDMHSSAGKLSQHRKTDSRSSIYSLSSTIDSSSHSRFSSISTTEGIQPPSKDQLHSTCENLSPRETPRTTAIFLPGDTGVEPTPNTTDYIQYMTLSSSHTNNGKENTCEKTRSSVWARNPNKCLMSPIKKREISSIESIDEKARPSSPSDAMLIKRQRTKLCLRLAKEDVEKKTVDPFFQRNGNFESKAESQRRNMPSFTSHKRANSAPNFHLPAHHATMLNPNNVVASVELTPPSSLHPDHPSPKISSISQAPVTPPLLPSELETQSIKCMYVEDCDTGSQLRKAISHIFGRNKICTRQIPGRVWVHYCRKHYQRSRYRNPKEYAKLQCDLVQQQIRRVHDWSQVNNANGRAGVVQDWTISVRKREQKRLDDIQNNRKRKVVSENKEEEEEDFNAEIGCKNSSSAVPATAVPEWLLEHCRKGYSTQEILEIFNRLHQEILNDSISTFPDIEILPNISIENEETCSPNTYIKRLPNTHKRAKSLTAGLSSIYESRDTKVNSFYSSSIGSHSNCSPARRMSSSVILGTPDSVYQQFPRSLPPDRSRRGSNLTVHSRMDENPIPEDFEKFSPFCKQRPLQSSFASQPGLNSQTNCQTEFGNSYQNLSQPPFHQRFISDYGNLSNLPMSETPVYSSVYSEAKPFFKEHIFDPSYFPHPQIVVSRDIPQDVQRSELRPGHNRYHSMPVVPFYPSYLPVTRECHTSINQNPNRDDTFNQASRNMENRHTHAHVSSSH